ncbi:MAG: cytochrome c biogenesis protein ResB [Flavobacteriales bacterium]
MKKEKIYQESFIIFTGLLFAGLVIEYVNDGKGVPQIQFPYNGLGLFFHILLGVILIFIFKKSALTQWLTKIPVSIVSMIGFLLVCTILGIVPQIETDNEWIQKFRLNNVTTSWYFTFMVFWMLTCLLLVGLKRIQNGIFKNGGFILNHIGLYIALVAGIFGSTDIQRVVLEVEENKLNWIVKDEVAQKPVELPFAIYLDEFILEEYLPKISIHDNHSGELITNQGKTIIEAKEGTIFEVEGNPIEIKKYLPFAIKFGEDFKQVYQYGASPAVLLESKGNQFWLASGTYNFPAQNYPITKDKTLILTFPEPKKYQSNIKIIDQKGNETKATLLVNETFHYEGWKIYQLGFDDKKGRWSEKSSFELIRDPWLPMVYIGIFMMIVGSVYMIWIGKRNKT